MHIKVLSMFVPRPKSRLVLGGGIGYSIVPDSGFGSVRGAHCFQPRIALDVVNRIVPSRSL